MADFNEQQNIGHAKYVVNFADGVKTHEDGSRFYDMRIFRNKQAKDRFLKELRKQGYVQKGDPL